MIEETTNSGHVERQAWRRAKLETAFSTHQEAAAMADAESFTALAWTGMRPILAALPSSPSSSPLPPSSWALDPALAERIRRDTSLLLRTPQFRGIEISGGLNGSRADGSRDREESALQLPGARLFGHRRATLMEQADASGAMAAAAAAKVFLGIGTIAAPQSAWRDSPFWRRYKEHAPFSAIHAVAREAALEKLQSSRGVL